MFFRLTIFRLRGWVVSIHVPSNKSLDEQPDSVKHEDPNRALVSALVEKIELPCCDKN